MEGQKSPPKMISKAGDSIRDLFHPGTLGWSLHTSFELGPRELTHHPRSRGFFSGIARKFGGSVSDWNAF